MVCVCVWYCTYPKERKTNDLQARNLFRSCVTTDEVHRMSEVLTCQYPDFDSGLCEGDSLREGGKEGRGWGGNDREKEKRCEERGGERKGNKRARECARVELFVFVHVSDTRRSVDE